MLAPVISDARRSRISGVWPMASTMLDLIIPRLLNARRR
jgi:hypothetical protein